MKRTNPRSTSNRRTRRGIALLLVMISLVVCSILTAGFLSSQGTSIGIARNERDAEKARGIAQSGLDLCCWLIKNRADWRTAMTPGNWLNNYTIGDGTVTVTAAATDGTNSFATDTTKPAILTATGNYGDRTFTLTATIGPTGGGTVFRGGNYVAGKITMGSSDSNGATLIDSYNSGIGSYSFWHGDNASFNSGYAGTRGLTIFANSSFNGSFTASAGADLASSVYTTYWWNVPVSTSQAAQTFVPGTILIPNLTGLADRGTISKGIGTYILNAPGIYDNLSLNGTAPWSTLNVTASGTYYIKGNLNLSNFSILNVSSGVTASIIVNGSLNVAGSSQIKTSGSGMLDIYVRGNTTISNNASINATGNTASITLFGIDTGTITIRNATVIAGSIYSPGGSIRLQNSAQLYGALLTSELSLTETSQFHFDNKLKSKRIDNLTNGSAPEGTANYNLTVVGSSAVIAR